MRAHPLPFADIEGDALSHAKLLRSLRPKDLNHRASVRKSNFSFIGIFRPPPAFTVMATRGSVPIGGPSEEKTGAPYCDSPTPPATYGVDWPTRGRKYKRLVLELSAWMRPSPRRYATSVSTLSVDVTGNVTAAPTGDAAGRTKRHIRRDFDGFCVLRPHWQCCKSERDECEDSRFVSPHDTSSAA